MPAHHYESSAVVPATAEQVFALVDDHLSLSAHMSKPSWKMGWGRMEIILDEHRGKSVGARICLAGHALGIRLALEEVVTERVPPHSKRWETVGSPRLLVIGHYRMGFEVTPHQRGSLLRVYIDYALPDTAPSRWFGRLLGRSYARWCTRQMIDDVMNRCTAPAS